jgi:hypothetical protein
VLSFRTLFEWRDSQVLDDGNTRGKQHAVHRTFTVAGVIDIERIDADQRGTRCGQAPGRRPGEIGITVKVAAGSPVTRPAGDEQHRRAGTVQAFEQPGIDAPAVRRHRNRHTLQMGHRGEGQVRGIAAFGIAVVRTVELGTDIGDEFHPVDAKAGARHILAATPVLPMRAHIVQLGLVEIPVFALL